MTNRSQPITPQALLLGPAAPVNPKEMSFAIQLFQAGMRIQIPMSNSEVSGIEVGDNDAAQRVIDSMPEALSKQFVARNGRIALEDTEVHRGAFVVLKHYDEHPLRQAIYIRALAFYLLANASNRNVWEKWHKPIGEQREVPLHPAVIEAVALVPTTEHGQFEAGEFFSTVERIAKQKYAKEG